MRAAVLVAGACLAAGPAAAQEVLRIRPAAGHVARYVMVTEVFVRSAAMAALITQPDSPLTRLTAWQTSRVTDVGDGEYTEEQVIDSGQVTFPAAPQMGAMMAQMGDLVAGTRTVLRMSSRGRMLAVEMTPSPALAQLLRTAGQGLGPLGMGSSQMSAPTFWLLPERAVRVGATWRDSVEVPLDSSGMAGGVVRMAGTYTLRAMDGRVATIRFDGSYAISGPGVPPGMSFGMTGDVHLDLAVGRLHEMTMRMTGSVPVPSGDTTPMEVATRLTAR